MHVCVYVKMFSLTFYFHNSCTLEARGFDGGLVGLLCRKFLMHQQLKVGYRRNSCYCTSAFFLFVCRKLKQHATTDHTMVSLTPFCTRQCQRFTGVVVTRLQPCISRFVPTEIQIMPKQFDRDNECSVCVYLNTSRPDPSFYRTVACTLHSKIHCACREPTPLTKLWLLVAGLYPASSEHSFQDLWPLTLHFPVSVAKILIFKIHSYNI